jgi:hypothetical protein
VAVVRPKLGQMGQRRLGVTEVMEQHHLYQVPQLITAVAVAVVRMVLLLQEPQVRVD